MDIRLDKNYKLTSNSYNVCLAKRAKDNKDGEEVFKDIGFYSTVQGALRGYLQQGIRNSNAQTIPELIEDINKIEAHIEDILKGN